MIQSRVTPVKADFATSRLSPDSTGAPRLLAIDAMRGLAALAVVFYHVPSAVREMAGLPPFLSAIFAHGALGVDAFFVLSGFVVALSTRRGPWTISYFGRFALRRSVRLDPPYWVAILLEVGLGLLGMTILHSKPYPVPSVGSVLAHLTYTQALLGFRQISDVFWTLCFEVQFYFCYVLVLVVATSHVVKRVIGTRVLLTVLFLAVFLASISIRSEFIPDPVPGIALIRAFEFLCGVATFLAVERHIAVWQALAVVLAATSIRWAAGSPAESLVLLASCLCCFASATFRTFNQSLAGPAWQFLGRISYSIYLYHASLIGRVVAVGLILFPVLGRAGASALIAFSVISSVLTSSALYFLIERPALGLSRRIPLRPHAH